MTYNKPIPVPDSESAPFWEGARRHELLIPSCADCGQLRYPPTTFCPNCHSQARKWIKSAGRGVVFSWVIVRHPVPKEIYASDVPYVVALVELDEGVRMVTNIVDCEPEMVVANMSVAVKFVAVSEEVTLPFFAPVSP